jgi:hypothetical protein
VTIDKRSRERGRRERVSGRKGEHPFFLSRRIANGWDDVGRGKEMITPYRRMTEVNYFVMIHSPSIRPVISEEKWKPAPCDPGGYSG